MAQFLLCAANGDVGGMKMQLCLLCAANGDVGGMKMQLCLLCAANGDVGAHQLGAGDQAVCQGNPCLLW